MATMNRSRLYRTQAALACRANQLMANHAKCEAARRSLEMRRYEGTGHGQTLEQRIAAFRARTGGQS